MGLTFDAWMFFHQLPELVDFARALPDLQIVINHIGGLLRIGPYAGRVDEVMATWRANIAAVAQCPNVYMKLGGIGMPRTGFDWHLRTVPIGSEELAAEMTPLFGYCIEQFGPQRCMFQSNFPVDKVATRTTCSTTRFKRMSAGYSPSERAAMFHDTATGFYRIA